MRECLADELVTADPLRFRALHLRAADHCEQAGDEAAAMRHVVAAPDVERAWSKFHDHWVERYFSGDFDTVLAWCTVLREMGSSDVDRESELAIAWNFLAQVDETERTLIEIGRRLGDVTLAENPTLEMARFFHAYARGSFDIALDHAARARDQHGAGRPQLWERVRASVGLVFLLSFVDLLDGAWREYQSSLRYQDPTSRIDAVIYPTALAHLALVEGRLADAESNATRALDAGSALGERGQTLLCEAVTTKAFVHLERNEGRQRPGLSAIDIGDAVAFAHVRCYATRHGRVLRRVNGRSVRDARGLPALADLGSIVTSLIASTRSSALRLNGMTLSALAGLPHWRGGRLQLIGSSAHRARCITRRKRCSADRPAQRDRHQL
jgi:hypothetical protein